MSEIFFRGGLDLGEPGMGFYATEEQAIRGGWAEALTHGPVTSYAQAAEAVANGEGNPTHDTPSPPEAELISVFEAPIEGK